MRSALLFALVCTAILSFMPACKSRGRAVASEPPVPQSFAAEDSALPAEPKELSVLRASYPDVSFVCTYDAEVADWLITITVPGSCNSAEAETAVVHPSPRIESLYWQEGRLLPKEALSEKESYWPLIYPYTEEIPDPATFTEEDIAHIRAFTSPENRTEGAGTSPFFYDVLYDCKTRISVESHIVKHRFLGKRTNIHERLCAPLDRVQERILQLAAADSEVKEFVNTLASADSYSWRPIGDSRKRSFHSMGIALDVLPRGWRKKNLYWAWRRDIDPENWMLLPLDRRWMPPLSVIQAFEAEGFIWGGKWIIWDNMHFEYHPELLLGQ